MLQIRLCTDRKINQKQMLQELCGCAARGETGQILIVPEQFSHMTERMLCEYGGDRIGRYAEVLSFSRLANRVFSEEGGIADTQTDASGRLLMMSLAAEQVHSRLKTYSASVSKPDFLLHLIDMFEEFRSYCVTPERLHKASEQLEGSLAQKTEEFALLMESFDAVSKNLGQNPESKLTRLLGALETGTYAEGKTFWLDGFTDFNGVEKEIITELLLKNALVTVLLQCDGLERGAQQFDAARDTARELRSIASDKGIECEVRTVPAPEEDTPLVYLRRRLFGGRNEPFPGPQDAIRFLHPADRETECRETAAEILRIVSEGARWRDVSVACADFAASRPVLESVFRHYDIPAYFAGDTDILRQPVVRMLLSALEAATGGMEQEDVLNYLKSGLTPLSREACDRIEKYVRLWNIRGSRWGREWTMNPKGIRNEADEATLRRMQEQLDRLNSDRARAIDPLLQLQAALKKAENTGEMVRALYAFTEKIKLIDRLSAFAEASREAGDPQAEQESAQVCGIVTDLLEQMFGVLGQSVRSAESFARLFRAAISQCSVGTIPASLDCVTVGSLMSQRRCDTDHVFLIGAQEGNFPSAQTQNSLLTDSERISLNQQGIRIAPTTAGKLNRELACIDSVLSAPMKRLCLSAVTGAEAYLVKRAAELFPNAALETDPSVCRAEREYLAHLVRASALPEENDPLRDRAARLIDAKNYEAGRLSAETVGDLYGDTLHFSASSIETLAKCRFSYFMKYGLRANEEETAEIDQMVYGTFVHYVLEHTVKQVQEEGGFHAVSRDRVLAIAEGWMKEYTERVLADALETERTKYLFFRNFAEVRAVVADLYREMSKSEFVPKWFELEFSKNGSLPMIRIAGQDSEAELEGRVDRVDVWENGGKYYVRVIDYKSGKYKKELDLTEVLNGIGLQMLLYLFALRQMGERLFGQEPEPAGALYFQAADPTFSIDAKDDRKLETKRRKSKKRSGVVLGDSAVLQAMEACEGVPEYMPSADDKANVRSGWLLTKEQMEQLGHFVFRCVGKLGDSLRSGEIAADPYYIDSRNNGCYRCPYKSVCRDHKELRSLQTVKDVDEFLTITGEEAQEDA